MLIPTINTVPIDTITINDIWYFSKYQNKEQDKLTAEATGRLLFPPVVVTNGEKNELLCGHDRFFDFCQHFPDTTQIAVISLPDTLSMEQKIEYSLHDKLSTTGFSPMEKASFLNLCGQHLKNETICNTILPKFGEKPQVYILEQFLLLLSLEQEIQHSIHCGKISAKIGRELVTLPISDRRILHELFILLELGGGKQKRLLSLCKDLANRNQQTILSLLKEDEYQKILTSSEMNTPQKGTRLLSLLFKRLFPESTAAEEEFQKKISSLHLPASCTVEHDPIFERDRIEVRVQFNDFNQLQKNAAIFKNLE